MTSTKLCRGPTHRDGPATLPVLPAFWHFHRSGPRTGMPYHRCKTCRTEYEKERLGGVRGWVPTLTVSDYAAELVLRVGNAHAVEVRYGISDQTLRQVIDRRSERVIRRTAQAIVTALIEQRRADRRDGITAERFRIARRKQVEREDRLERLAGY